MSQESLDTIPDITGLSELFLDTLKELKKSGSVLNAVTLSQFLARKPVIKNLIRLAKDAQNENVVLRKRTEMKNVLQSIDSTADQKEKNIVNRMVEEQVEFNKERDFMKRFTLMLLNLAAVPGNESFFDLIEEYKQLLVDEAAITNRERVYAAIKNRMLNTNFGKRTDQNIVLESLDSPSSKQKASIFRRILRNPSEVRLPVIKKALMKGLDELQSLLGSAFEDSISIVRERVQISDDLDYILSLRKQILDIIENYASLMKKERNEASDFVKEIGKKLLELQGELTLTFSSTTQVLQDEVSFQEKLGEHISVMSKTIESGQDFEELKRAIITELSTITDSLDEKRREYSAHLSETTKEKERLQKQFETMVGNVIKQNQLLIERNQRDPLTGIYNRATFEDTFARELDRYQRYMEPFAFLIFDIDLFKQVNDTYGHEAGDRVLRGISNSVNGVIRKTDVFARYGGEEFVLLMPMTDIEKGIGVAQKIRETVESTEFNYEGSKVPVTISVGITQTVPTDRDFKSVFTRADSLLYQAKRNGRNQVISDRDVPPISQ